jgi:orotate phosphoribosyltransferase
MKPARWRQRNFLWFTGSDELADSGDGARAERQNRVPVVSSPTLAEDTAELVEQIKALAIVRGQVTLSSGRTADYYVDLRRVTLDGRSLPSSAV